MSLAEFLLSALVITGATQLYLLFKTARFKQLAFEKAAYVQSLKFAEALQDRFVRHLFYNHKKEEGFAIVSPRGEFLEVEENFARITGWPVSDLLKKTYMEITARESLAGDNDLVHRMLLGEIESYSLPKAYLSKESEKRNVLLTVFLLRDASGAPKNFLAMIRAIKDNGRGTNN